MPMGGLLGPGPTGFLQAKSAFSAKQKMFGVGFNCGDHHQNSSAHGAILSPESPWPYGMPKARGNKASAAILSQGTLGLGFVPRAHFPLQNAAPRSAFGAVFELGPRWGPL